MTARPFTFALFALFAFGLAFAISPMTVVWGVIYIAPVLVVSALWGLRDL